MYKFHQIFSPPNPPQIRETAGRARVYVDLFACPKDKKKAPIQVACRHFLHQKKSFFPQEEEAFLFLANLIV